MQITIKNIARLVMFPLALYLPYYVVLTLITYNEQPPIIHECQNKDPNTYCTETNLYDGLVRFSVKPSHKKGCCIVERYNIDEARLTFKISACSKPIKTALDCTNFQKSINYGVKYKIDNVILDKDQSLDDAE